MDLLNLPLYGGTVYDWIVALGLSVAIALGVYLIKPLLIRRLSARAERTATQIDDGIVRALRATRVWLIVVFAASLGSRYLELPDAHQRLLGSVTAVAMFLQLGFWLSAMFQFWLDRSRERALASNSGAATSLAAIGFIGTAVLWTVVLLVALDNLGVNITAAVAGLGVGGIAVALAVQNILGDLFASLSIIVDKPFVIGDFVIIDDYMGTVQHVGLKTTRLRSLSGEQLVFSNSDLLKSRLRNYKQMQERRVVFSFGVLYDTTAEQLERIPEIVRELVAAETTARFDRAHFFKFGESSLDFEVVYIVLSSEYNVYMDIQQRINLGLMRELAALGVGFAYPTRTLRVETPLRIAPDAPASA